MQYCDGEGLHTTQVYRLCTGTRNIEGLLEAASESNCSSDSNSSQWKLASNKMMVPALKILNAYCFQRYASGKQSNTNEENTQQKAI